MKIQILEEAQEDIARAMLFYEKQREELCKYFLNSIMADIESLHIYCGIHIQIKNFYRLLAKRFPYSIYYKFDEEYIYVYAILDCRQNPFFIDTILQERD